MPGWDKVEGLCYLLLPVVQAQQTDTYMNFEMLECKWLGYDISTEYYLCPYDGHKVSSETCLLGSDTNMVRMHMRTVHYFLQPVISSNHQNSSSLHSTAKIHAMKPCP